MTTKGKILKIYPLFIKSLFFICFFLLLGINSSLSEGTKQFRPASSDFGNLQINDLSRPFALESNTDSLHRLYFHIANTSEKVYFGFKHVGTGSATFRIKDPGGNVVYAQTTVPSSGTGYISTYNQAVAGPKINGTPSGGYTPFVFTPVTTGDFYIEFTTTLTTAYHFDLFDLTVKDASNNSIPGRLWSYAWDLNTRSYDNKYNGSFYVYADDKYVSKLNLNGVQPYGFVISCNNTGPGNTPLGNNENRKSVEGNSTRPQYKIFLNNPDSNVYFSGQIPQIIQNLGVVGTPHYKDTVKFYINMSVGGTVEVIINLDGNPGYQSGTKDVVLVQEISAGGDTIYWDAKDGLDNYVDETTPVIVITSSFASGVTHFPLFDPETNTNGFIVTRIRPITGVANIYWDDSNFSEGIVNIDGSITNGHSWAYFFGDERTMDTWWEGYKLPVLNNFQFQFENTLPIELIFFNAEQTSENFIKFSWETATETNNDYFTIEKSFDNKFFEEIGKINGAGNSNSPINYTYYYDNKYGSGFYYRLKQTDYDENYTYSNVVTVKLTDIKTPFEFKVSPNIITGNELNITFSGDLSENNCLYIINQTGQIIYHVQIIVDYTSGSNSNKIVLPNNFSSGVYFVELCDPYNKYISKIVKK